MCVCVCVCVCRIPGTRLPGKSVFQVCQRKMKLESNIDCNVPTARQHPADTEHLINTLTISGASQ